MSSVSEIKQHLKAVEQTRQITNAMYLLSTSRMKKAMQHVDFNLFYLRRLRATIKDVLSKVKNNDISNRFIEDNGKGSAVFVARGGRLLGYILLSDRIKVDTAAAIAALRRAGITHTVMLSGDRASTAEQVARTLGLDECRAELLPADKVDEMERIRQGRPHGKLMYAGDGINDAPVIAASDVGVAMGALGADAAAVAADVVLMDDSLSALPRALLIARKTRRIVWQNVIFSLGVKVAVMVFSLLFPLGMWAAVFADVGVSVIAILNATRASRIG